MTESFLPQSWLHQEELKQLKSPCIIVDYHTLVSNIKRMAQFAAQHQVQLRPHLKTHKTAEIAQLQLQHGAIGFTVAKISEAEALVQDQNFQNTTLSILIAFPIVGEYNLQRLLPLQNKANLTLMVDSIQQARELHQFASHHKTSFPVLIKINTGLNRCGIEPQLSTVQTFLEQLLQLDRLRLQGIMTHAGHSYGAKSNEERRKIGTYEGTTMVQLGQFLKELYTKPETTNTGLPHPTTLVISVGSTPTVTISGAIEGVTEIRPGNYVFNDRTQVTLGSATWQDCSLRVVSRVVSHPAENRWIIDAGSKTLALDQGAHGQSGLSGYGYVVGHPELTITRLSEEHGVIEGAPANALQIGELIEIIPNHACPVVNLANELFVLHQRDKETRENNCTISLSTWKVLARGKNY